MENPKLISDAERELFRYAKEGNAAEIKRLINDLKPSVNCSDEQGMTPLQHAAFKGHYEVCKLLLDCGADVNENEDLYGYNALSLAAVSNHCDVVTLLLEYGADPTAINSNKRTAAEVAAFVGNHKPVSIMNNYLAKDIIDYFTEIHGLESEPRLPKFLSGPVHKLVIMPTIHPVRIVLYIQSNRILLENIKKVIDVLNIMAEKQLKDMTNDQLSLKLHHYAFVLQSASDYIMSQKKKSAEQEISDEKILDGLMKSWLKGTEDCAISSTLENFIRKSMSAYPFANCFLYKQIISTISTTEPGDEPTAFILLTNAIFGQPSSNSEFCATCGDQDSPKLCTGCKKVRYCNKTCQKLHWFIHKSCCKK